MIPVIFLDAAQDDLEEIFAYIADHDVETANKFIEKLRRATQRLSLFPLSAAPNELYGVGVRKLSAHGYAIFYRVSDTAVLISRVIHGRRDFWEGDF